MQINKVILQEYKAMALHSFSDGQIEVDFPDENNLSQVRVFLKPNDGFYKDGKFEFEVVLPQNYPQSAPTVTCKTKMFHPNISYTGSICFNILSSEWEPSLRLVDYVHSLLWLLYQPNLDSRLNGDCPSDELQFAALVKQSIRGGRVKGTHFPCALADPSILERERPTITARPVNPRTISELRAFFDALAGPATTPTQPRFVRRQQPQQPAETQQPQQVAEQQPQPEEETPATQQPQPQQVQPEEETPAAQQPQEAAEVQPVEEPAEVQQPQQPQPQGVAEQQPQEGAPAEQQHVEEPAEAQQPQQPQQPQQAAEQQPQVTPTQQQPQQARAARNGNVAANMRWAQFIMPAIQTYQPLQPIPNHVRRWAPVAPPLRFAGAVRVY